MKYKGEDEIARWRDLSPQGKIAQDRAAALIAGALSPGEPDARRLLRVERALFYPERSRRASRLLVLAAVVAVVMVVGVASVKAYEMARRAGWFGLRPTATSSAPIKPSVAARVTAAGAQDDGRTSLAAPSGHAAPVAGAPVSKPTMTTTEPMAVESPSRNVALAAAEPDPSARPAARAGERRSGHRNGRASGARLAYARALIQAENKVSNGSILAEPSTSSPSPIEGTPSLPTASAMATSRAALPPAAPAPSSSQEASDEVHALDYAMALLRRDHDGAAALAALDAYLGRYPRGLFIREAYFARVDALLLLGRSDQALAALEALPLDRGRRSTELQVIRAELRARRSCSGAELDFSAALAQSPGAGLVERILYGRGLCRSKLGDVSGATDDLQRYLDRFPNGPHARSAREWLGTEARPSHGNLP